MCSETVQGRKKTREGGAVVTGGVALAAAQAAADQKKAKRHADFYRFQQRDKRRNGATEQACAPLHVQDIR